MRFLLPLLLLLLLMLHLAAQDPAPASAAELTFLQNYGFLISAGEDRVLLDGLFRTSHPYYGFVPEATRQAAESGSAPFDEVDLVLVSHHHGDHFDARAVAEHLLHNPQARLLSSPQVVEEVLAALQEGESLAGRTEGLLPEHGAPPVTRRFGRITVEIQRISHGTGRMASVQNLGHVVTVGGVRFAHFGDMDLPGDKFAALELDERSIDVAMLPYWWLTGGKRSQAVRAHLGARWLVGAHVPPEELAEAVGQVRAEFPEAIVFPEPLARHSFRRAEPDSGQ